MTLLDYYIALNCSIHLFPLYPTYLPILPCGQSITCCQASQDRAMNRTTDRCFMASAFAFAAQLAFHHRYKSRNRAKATKRMQNSHRSGSGRCMKRDKCGGPKKTLKKKKKFPGIKTSSDCKHGRQSVRMQKTTRDVFLLGLFWIKQTNCHVFIFLLT